MENRATITEAINRTFIDNNQKFITAEKVRAFMDIINDSKFNLVDDDISKILVNSNNSTTLNQEINEIKNSKLEVALDWECKTDELGNVVFNNNFGTISGSPSNFSSTALLQTIRCNFSQSISGRYVVVSEGVIQVLAKSSTFCTLRWTGANAQTTSVDWRIQILRTQ